jgi:4-hydroxyphenylpyruvate dioxygenase
MRVCISQATTLAGTFDDDIRDYAAAGCDALEVWLTKLEQHLDKHSLSDTRKLLADRALTPAAAAYQGGLLISQGEARRAHLDHFKRRLDLCQGLGIRTLLVAADYAGKVEPAMLPQAVAGLQEAARWADGFGVRLALEFRRDCSFCASLDTALSLVAACGEANVGVCLDVFHYYTGPSKSEDLALLTRDNLAFVQVCDVAGVPRELAGDADRILPGEGDFQLGPIVDRLRAIDYDGWVSLEAPNPMLWRAKATQVAELGWAAVKRLLADDSTGRQRRQQV